MELRGAAFARPKGAWIRARERFDEAAYSVVYYCWRKKHEHTHF